MSNFVRPIWEKNEFKQLFTDPINDGQAKDATTHEITRMKRRSFLLTEQMKQFVHRKDQSILKVDLPSKHEYVIYVPLTEFQKKLYQNFLAQLDVDEAKRNVLQLVSWLSKIATHPDLIKKILQRKGVSQSSFSLTSDSSSGLKEGGKDTGTSIEINSDSDDSNTNSNNVEDLEALDLNIPLDWASPVFDKSFKERDINLSSKMKVLFKIIEKCLKNDEKLLVFSQYTSTLDLMEDLIATRKFNSQRLRKGVDYTRLDGTHSLTTREKNIKDFNSNYSKKKVFFISTRAGSLGINLQAATRIVLFDVCWNPAEDQQAIFRAYRYGQTKPVCVYRLISAGDIEENIWKRCISKTWLFRRVVDEKTPARMLSKDDLNLFDFEQNQKKISENVVDYKIIKDDKIMIEVATEMGVGINRILEHESLFIDDKFDQITDAEKETAKIELADAKRFSQNHLLNASSSSSSSSYSSSLNSQLTRTKNEFLMGGKHQGMSLEELKLKFLKPQTNSYVDHHMNQLSNSFQSYQPKIEYSKYGNFIQNQYQQVQPHMKQKFQNQMDRQFQKSPSLSQSNIEYSSDAIDFEYLKQLQEDEKRKQKTTFSHDQAFSALSKHQLKSPSIDTSLSLLNSTQNPKLSVDSLLAPMEEESLSPKQKQKSQEIDIIEID